MNVLYVSESGMVREYISCPRSPGCPLWDNIFGCKNNQPIMTDQPITVGDCINAKV